VDSVSHVIVVRDLSVSPWPEKRCVLTIGAYDGVHRGHQAVIAAVREQAKSLNALSVVVTFDKHPASVVRPESAPLLLTDLEQKIELLSTTGVDAVVVVPFNEEQSTENPEAFVKRVLVDCLHVQHIVVGEDFHFGKNRSGNVALLRTEGAQHDFTTGPLDLLARQDGVEEPISSTAIRRALRGGEIDTATALLGHSFEVRGPVVTGDQRGRTIGFATANVQVPGFICLPADGVYAGIYTRPSGKRYACAINLGRRPTFYEHSNSSLLEAHLIDESIDLYGEDAKVQFTHFLRSERKFNGPDALIAQVKLDVDHARELINSLPPGTRP
jgi:riboflavin kinase/FMN adenylyltransferase